jgi:RHS repeat-associated protein
MRVAPGDIINLEVFAKYVDPNANDLTPDLANLLSQISSGSASSVIDGAGYLDNLASTFPFLGLLNTGGEVSDAPKAYLNWLVFDKNFVFKTGGFVRISDKAKENGSNVTHEKLVSPPIAITEPGYFYTYLSNEEDTPVEVFFDDFKVSQIKSHLLQSDDYYPLGLSISSTAFDRDNENYKGQVTTEGLGTKDLGFRSLDPAIGRFQAVDPLAEIQITESPYQFAGNNSISSIDLFGLIGDEIDENDVWDSIEKIADEKMAQKDGDTYEMSQVRQLPSRQKSKSADLSETETSEQELMSSSRNESGDIFGANDVAKGRGRKRGKRTHWWNGYSLYKGKKSRKSSGSSSSSSDGDWFDLVAGREIQNAGGLDKPDHRLDLTALSRASDFLGDYTHDQFTGANERNTDDIVDLLIGRSYKRAQTETNFQELKRYFLTNHPGNEARALLASAKGGISDFSFLADLERNVTSITMTSTSDDAFGNEEKVLTRGELQSDPRFRPLTTQAMRDKAKEQCPTCEQWKVNVIAGNALEYAWNRMSGISRNFSNKFSNDVRSKNVRPDFVFTKTEHTTKDNGEPDLFKYDKGVFVEVKASQNTLDKSAFNNQLWAELNALSKQKGSGLSDWSFGVLGKNAPDGVLTYLLVVTEGTIVSNDLIEEATSLGISFFISYTYENVQTGGVVFSAPERMNTFGSATGEGSQIEEIVNIKAPQTGVQLEMDRANFFLTRSNEYDETQP